MSLYLGETLIAGGSSYHPNIFDIKWSDHILNDIQWLRADTFSWQSGDVYITAYNKLVEEYSTGTEETEGSITFRRSSNNFKIATSDMESAILNKYNSDGISWYYILDTTNKRFKLPRTKFGFEGVRDKVGDDIAELGKGSVKNATQMYLYFYVGEYAQSAVEQTAGLNSELFNGKLDVSTYNANPRNEAVYLKTTYVNGTSGYNIWSNGYCEQWGKYYVNTSGSSTTFTISFLKTFNDTNYNFILSAPDMASGFYGSNVQSINVDSISWKLFFNASIYIGSVQWKVSGYLAEGQY